MITDVHAGFAGFGDQLQQTAELPVEDGRHGVGAASAAGQDPQIAVQGIGIGKDLEQQVIAVRGAVEPEDVSNVLQRSEPGVNCLLYTSDAADEL